MTTTTQLHIDNAEQMEALDDASVDLVVTSPPYPMIEMWDDLFASWAPESQKALKDGRPDAAFDIMHQAMHSVWEECARVLKVGGICCINIGDATRTTGGTFRLYPNHARIIEDVTALGLHQLPGILWRKSTNKPNKFMGSGMIPPNAYVTLEHEHILIFRKQDKRTVSQNRRNDRYESAYFWEERNRWFSDLWTDVRGTTQALSSKHSDLRARSAAFPLEVPLRLINMYSVAGDTVLDPFWGTGTTSLAAAMLRRNSVGYELEAGFTTVFDEAVRTLPQRSRQYNAHRIERHRQFLRERDDSCKHTNRFYEFGVVTKQEKDIVLYDIDTLQTPATNRYKFAYQPHGVQTELFVA
ncbi:MAG: site-specific DNA-methyltransferase [Longimonas sp.]|uniref:DNA-methyltransferase n=1 Tax=Longimonas sp. TaxID=2039626 RepID=UPI00334CED4B